MGWCPICLDSFLPAPKPGLDPSKAWPKPRLDTGRQARPEPKPGLGPSQARNRRPEPKDPDSDPARPNLGAIGIFFFTATGP